MALPRITDDYRLVAEWAAWAAAVFEGWPDEPRDASADPDELPEPVQRAAWSQTGSQTAATEESRPPTALLTQTAVRRGEPVITERAHDAVRRPPRTAERR
ncbi:hypothetical protein ACFUJR_10980 [Streptomyces sp. NPDC057271]|uniref:hypothetical protein n=1 Tax=unclassified Streptomyces TaxID=2593676 RepID=UPI0036341CFA